MVEQGTFARDDFKVNSPRENAVAYTLLDLALADEVRCELEEAPMEDAVDKPGDPLTQCEEVVEQLKEENAQLRESAQTFADLAERLNAKKRPGNSESNDAT